jgi:hypothetical protein
VAVAAPGTRAMPSHVGATYRVSAEEVVLDPRGGAKLVNVEPADAALRWDPLAVPELVDPGGGSADLGTMRATVTRWIEDTLAPALHRAYPSMAVERPLTFVADVVWPTARDAFSITVSAPGATVRRDLDPDWDVLNRIAGSRFFEVVEGRFHWGDVLLGGLLRAVSRAYEVGAGGAVRPGRVGKTFLYYGLPYDEAVRRSVEWEVERALESARAP